MSSHVPSPLASLSRRGLAGAILLAVAGCALPVAVSDGSANPSLFPTSPRAADAHMPVRIALVVPATVSDSTYTGARLHTGAHAVKLPIGRIVDAALQRALAAAFAGVQRFDAAPDAVGGFAATVTVVQVEGEYEESLAYLLPLPPMMVPMPVYEVGLRVGFELRLSGSGGATMTRSYQSDRLPWRLSLWSLNPAGDTLKGVVQLAHDAAWQQARQAAQDLANWLEAERMRPRVL